MRFVYQTDHPAAGGHVHSNDCYMEVELSSRIALEIWAVFPDATTSNVGRLKENLVRELFDPQLSPDTS